LYRRSAHYRGMCKFIMIYYNHINIKIIEIEILKRLKIPTNQQSFGVFEVKAKQQKLCSNESLTYIL